MKYSHSSKYRKTCAHDPDTRAQLGFRLRYARLKLGWSIEDAGKYFQVTDRTWHNWENGSHRIPFAVYKLARILARLELPGEAWAGWRLEGVHLITPEGRQIAPQDGSWWSLLVRQAAGFRAAYDEAARLRRLLAADGGDTFGGRQSQRAESGAAAGLVPFKTSGNGKQVSSSQNDVIMQSWPILYDSQTPLTPLHAPKPTTSESPLTPSFASPWMPICGVRLTLQRPKPGPHLTQMGEAKRHLKQILSNPQSSPEPKSRPSMNEKSASARHCSGPDSQSPRGAL